VLVAAAESTTTESAVANSNNRTAPGVKFAVFLVKLTFSLETAAFEVWLRLGRRLRRTGRCAQINQGFTNQNERDRKFHGETKARIP